MKCVHERVSENHLIIVVEAPFHDRAACKITLEKKVHREVFKNKEKVQKAICVHGR